MTVEELERRVLILAPTGRDAGIAASVLSDNGIPAGVAHDINELADEIGRGVGALLLAEEAIVPEKGERLARVIARQPPWSDVPVLLLTRPGADSPTIVAALEQLGNVTVVERPTRISALMSMVRVALRARQRQYQTRASLLDRERTAEALRDADRRKDEFLAMLAHELRNPLAPICNSIYILRKLGTESPATTPLHDMLDRQSKHMVRLVDDLLDVSRITRGKIELRREPIDLASIVRNAVETSRPSIDSGKHTLTVTLPATPIMLEADPVRLAQVFANLLNNAAKYTAEGGQIWLSAEQRGRLAVVSVRDNGFGIPPTMLTRVFELFAQVDGSMDRSRGGLGIGLTLVRSLVEMHGGSVEALSRGTGHGSEFVVSLPALGHVPATTVSH